MATYEDGRSSCYFHPKQVLIGVCPFCLNERLLVLAAKQGHHPHHNQNHASLSCRGTGRRTQTHAQRKPPFYFRKIFAFGSLFNRVEAQQWRFEHSDHDASTTTSEEDSFISIKIGDNGVASWEKSAVNMVSLENGNNIEWKSHHNLVMQNKGRVKEIKSVIEHGKSSQASLRWRKRICHWLQLIRWKRTSACHVGGKVEGVQVRKGWMSPLTKRSNAME